MTDTPIAFDNEDYIDLHDLRSRLVKLAEQEMDGSIDDEEQVELDTIRTVLDDIGTCAGIQLIREEQFEDYIREFMYDAGEIRRDSLADSHINWESVADTARIDYHTIVVGDTYTFLIRS